MNRKPRFLLRLGASILVLAALVLTPRSTLAVPQPPQSQNPNPVPCSAVNPDPTCSTGQIIPGPFEKSISNPLLGPGTAGSWTEYGAMSPSVLWINPTYMMWYSGTDADFVSAIGYATSGNGVVWSEYASNPVLTKGAPGSWDAGGVSFASVIPDGDGYKMWYTGTGGGLRRIGYATSADGILWEKFTGNPVLTVGSAGAWDANRVSNPTVVKVGSTYHLWYSSGLGSAGGIGHATSPDGTTWTKDAANPVLPAGSGSWDDVIFAPAVIYEDCKFQLFYTGCDSTQALCQIGFSTSLDGITWTKRGVVLAVGGAGAFDANLVGYPSVMLGVPYYRLWYTGTGADELYRIGLATALRLDKWLYLPAVLK